MEDKQKNGVGVSSSYDGFRYAGEWKMVSVTGTELFFPERRENVYEVQGR